jgi:hypothetical protein
MLMNILLPLHQKFFQYFLLWKIIFDILWIHLLLDRMANIILVLWKCLLLNLIVFQIFFYIFSIKLYLCIFHIVILYRDVLKSRKMIKVFFYALLHEVYWNLLIYPAITQELKANMEVQMLNHLDYLIFWYYLY